MKKVEELKIVYTTVIALDTVEMVLRNRYISQHALPGQFLHIHVKGHTLRRPISIADVNREEETVTILFKVVGSGTSHLASYGPGMHINALGPNGNGFTDLAKPGETVLIAGGGIGVPPLYYLGKTLEKNRVKVISVLGFQSKNYVFYEKEFNKLGETFIVTDDGSYGEKGFVTDVLDHIGSFARYYSCGPAPMLQAITKKLDGKPGYISLEERMGCGVGTCFACVIPANTEGGYKKICQDGPVFLAQEVSL
ncbi:dihydroorotate dehydrogenase electron transfer subunit [Virgibacillus kimchii]